MPDKPFVAFENYHVLIPYSDLEKMIKVVHEVEEIKSQYSQLQAQYTAIQCMFSECLQIVKDIKDFVKD